MNSEIENGESTTKIESLNEGNNLQITLPDTATDEQRLNLVNKIANKLDISCKPVDMDYMQKFNEVRPGGIWMLKISQDKSILVMNLNAQGSEEYNSQMLNAVSESLREP